MCKLLKKIKEFKMPKIESETIRSIVYLSIVIASVLFPLLYQCIDALMAWDYTRIHIVEEFSDGNFCLYTISLITPMLYVVDAVLNQEYSARKVIKLPFLESFTAIIIAIMVYCNNYSHQNDKVIRPLAFLSIALFIWSITIAYRIHQFEIKNSQSPMEIRKDTEDKILQQMDDASSTNKPTADKSNNGKTGSLVDDSFDEMEDFD